MTHLYLTKRDNMLDTKQLELLFDSDNDFDFLPKSSGNFLSLSVARGRQFFYKNIDTKGFVMQLIPAITDIFYSTVKEILQEMTTSINTMLVKLEAIQAYLILAITSKQTSSFPALFLTPLALFPIPPVLSSDGN